MTIVELYLVPFVINMNFQKSHIHKTYKYSVPNFPRIFRFNYFVNDRMEGGYVLYVKNLKISRTSHMHVYDKGVN